MTLVRVWASPCVCGFDVMELSPVPIGVRAQCARDFGGCGCFVCGGNDVDAVAAWNRLQGHCAPAVDLMAEAVKRAGGGRWA